MSPPRDTRSTERMVDYDRHSRMQDQAVLSKAALLAKVVARIGALPDEFVMCDYGCGPGRSAANTVRPVLAAYRQRSPQGPFVARHVDQEGNDWNALAGFAFGPDGYRGEDRDIRTELVVGSFYDQVAAPGSVALGTCFTAVHWLSAPPRVHAPQTLWFADLEGSARDAFRAQAQADWTRFLRMRARELRPGGHLVVVSLSAVPDASEPNGVRASSAGIYRAMGRVARSMVDDGLLKAEALDGFVVPGWFRSAEEACLPLDRERDVAASFELIDAHVGHADYQPLDLFAPEIDRPDAYAASYTGYMRGFADSTLRLHLFAKSADDPGAVDALADEFYRRFAALYRAEPGAHAAETLLLTLTLRRR